MVEYRQVKGKDLKKYGKFVKNELHLKEGIHCLPRVEICNFIVKQDKNSLNFQNMKDNE